MFTESEVKHMMREVFEEAALSLGCLATDHQINDQLITDWVEDLSTIRGRVLGQIQRDKGSHPAIEAFLEAVRAA